MNAKEYLNQARHLDCRINSKISQVESLNALATKCTTVFSDMPKVHNSSNMGDIVVKIISLENEINKEIDALVDLKEEIKSVIEKVKNIDYRVLLEERYLCMRKWEDIADDLHFSTQQIFRLHSKALSEVDKILKVDSKCD